MKSPEKLRESYEKQLKIFEDSKSEKIKNLEDSIKAIDSKIDRLSKTRESLLGALDKERGRNFRSFSDFEKKAEEQAHSQKKEEV